MSKLKRFLVFLVVIGVSCFFLWPTVRWYFIVPEDQKTLALGSREQIREYANQAAADKLRAMVALGPDAPLSSLSEGDDPVLTAADVSFLTKEAKKAYRERKAAVPSSWTVKALMDAWPTSKAESTVMGLIEGRYRDSILSVKNLQKRAIQLGLDLSGGMSVNIEADMVALGRRLGHAPNDEERNDAMNRGIELLKNRIDTFGLTEPVIRRMGENRIYVEIPGTADPERINSIIMGKGNLTFQIVDDEATARVKSWLAQSPASLREDGSLIDPATGRAPEGVLGAGLVVRKVYQRDKYGIDEFTGEYLAVEADVAEKGLDGTYITDARVSYDTYTGNPAVAFTLNSEGADKFFSLTSANQGRRMAILLDGRVKSYATIQSAIRSNGQITGLDQEEATNVSTLLRTAALPVELQTVSQRAIGASLGSDAIRQGANALLWGVIAVMAFMLLYYKGAGINAIIAQVLNLFIMISVLSAFNLTLTLPSIAGFVLTLGMSIDANVIVFERIKDEMRLGKGRKASIEAGFHKAFWSVMDGNITTIIAAVFLASLGSGPIQGFAITLAIGNVTSLFTALFVSHLIFDFGTDVMKSKGLSISWRTTK